MMCEKLREELMEVVLSGPEAASPEAREHLRSCTACANELASFAETMALLDEWQAPEPSPYFNSRLMARVREEAAAPARSLFAWLRRPVLAVAAAVLFATGYQPDTIGSPVWNTLQGDYFLSLFRPFSLPNAGTEQMQAAMEKYAGFTSTQFPTFSQYEAWAGADLMIKGLLLDGPNPTQAGVISQLRGVTSYDANGLLPVTLDYATNFGKNPPQTCAWILQAAKTGFNLVSPTPTCGTDLPHTDTASSS